MDRLTLQHLEQIWSRRLFKLINKNLKLLKTLRYICHIILKTLLPKEILLSLSNISFGHNVFKSRLLQWRLYASPCDEELTWWSCCFSTFPVYWVFVWQSRTSKILKDHYYVSETILLSAVSAGFSLSTCSAINVEAEQISLSTKECSMFLYSICERPVTGTATSIPKTSNAPVVATKPNWMKHHRHEYYVMENAVTYKEAERRCRDKLNSSLAFFTLANAYFEMTLTLNLEPGDYWVGGMYEMPYYL